MRVGVPKERKQDAYGSSRFGDVVRVSSLEPGQYVYRILAGVKRFSKIFWPSIVSDPEEGWKPTTKVVIVPEEQTVLDLFAKIDKRVKIESGFDPKEVKSDLDRQTSWAYLAFDRSSDELKVIQLEVPYSVFDALSKIEETIDPKNPDMLLYGLIYMYDVIITKHQDKSKKGYYGISYSVEVDPRNKFVSKVNKKHLTEELEIDFVEKGIFTREETDKILSCSIDLDQIYESSPNQEIINKVREFPINLNARRQERLVFTNPQRMAKEAGILQLPSTTPEGQIPEMAEEVSEPRSLPESTETGMEEGEFKPEW